MKKFVIFLFAICQATSSLADIISSPDLIITCENKGDINCTLSQTLEPTSCEELKKTTITSTDILYITGSQFDTCSKRISTSINKSKCPAIQTAFVGDRQYLLFCVTNPNIEVRYTDDPTDKWSYAHKQCVGSWGKWDETNQSCDCSALEGATTVDYECRCTNNTKQKYYNKLWTGCATLTDDAYLAGTTTKVQGFGYNLSEIDKANSCSPSGGTWQGSTNNTCKCDRDTLHMEPDSTGYFCNCENGYDYKNPLAKTDGCMLIKDIPDHPDNLNDAAESTTEQPTITTNPGKNCTNTGGTGPDGNGNCICDASKFLVEDKYEGNYSICRCMDGYHRNSKPDADGKYKAEGECIPANDYEIQQVPNTEKYRQDAENAYRNEYDNAQSWANKGVTGLSTLMTGEGAKMAAQAWAEQIADRDAETEMTDYLAGMRCEYGNGNTVKLGDETNLPGGNELANYYAEYKTLADKLKTTKAALNLRSGIEAEVLYDRAETGLYQYRVAEIATGDNVSLARALMNPDGDDATKWNTQKAETKQNLWTGVGLAATGVVAGYAANQYVNRNHEKKYKDLTMTFTEIKKELQIKYPEAFVPEEIPVTPVTEEPIIATIEETPPVIEQPQQATQLDLEPFSDKYLFASGSYKLKNNVSALDDYIQRVIDTLNRPEYADFKICIQIDGHTDRVPPKPGFMSNQALSQKRADSVKDYLDTELGSIKTHISNITSTGHGEEQCTKDKYKKIDDSNCRRIDIIINACDN